MCLCACALRGTSRLTSTYSTYRLFGHITKQSQRRFTPSNHSLHFARRRNHWTSSSAKGFVHRKSGTGLYTAVIVFGIAIGGTLLFPLVRHITEEKGKRIERAAEGGAFEFSDYTDSLLIMAPNTPPGRPGTLTPEQEAKLRELWVLTLKVFGVYEPLQVEVNGTETPSTTANAPTADSIDQSLKKEKKKSRLNVFRRYKDDKKDKDGESEPSAAPGTATPSDISSLSIADEDDKHGLNKDFKAAIANTAPEDLRKAFWSMIKLDHPDALLLRFLRARKWDVDKALVMMISTMHWRAEEMHVDDDIMKTGELGALQACRSEDAKTKKEGEDFLTQMRIGKSFLHGVDKEGRPCTFVRVRLHRQGEQSEESLERFTVYTIETARMLLRPPVDTATVVFDMTSFSMANMDYAPVKFMIKCFEANYPESLGAVLVYKAPWVFNAIWTIIRGWLDPVVAGKVHFTKNIEELENFIPRTQIPTELGGDEQWEYQYVEPKEDENVRMSEEGPKEELLRVRNGLVSRYEKAVLEWIHEGEKGAPVDESLEKRRRERDTIAEELRTNYWKLDPYVRARTLYDRTGVIGEGGKLNFYPSTKEEKKEHVPPEAPQATTGAPETSADDLD